MFSSRAALSRAHSNGLAKEFFRNSEGVPFHKIFLGANDSRLRPAAFHFGEAVGGCACTLGEGLLVPRLAGGDSGFVFTSTAASPCRGLFGLLLAADDSESVLISAAALPRGLVSVVLVLTGVPPAYLVAALSKGSDPAGGATAPVRMLRNGTIRP